MFELLPQIGYKPDGFLGGAMWAEQRDDYRQMMSLQKLLSELGVRGAQEEMTQGAPVRAAKRLSDIATAQTNTRYAMPKMAGEVEERSLKNTATRMEQPSKMAANIAAYIATQGESGYKQFQTGLKFALTAGQVIKNNGPVALPQLQQQAQSMGLPPQMVQMVMSNPEETVKLLQAVDMELQSGLIKDRQKQSAEYKQATNVANIQGTAARDVAGINSEARIQAANIRSALAQQTLDLKKKWQVLNERITQGKSTNLEADKIEADRIAQMLASLQTLGIQQQQGMVESATGGAIRAPGQVQPPLFNQPGASELSKFTPPQRDWIKRAQQANPGVPLEQIIAEGKKRGKL